MKSLTVGQKVNVVVNRVLPFGIFALLDDGSHAYIRRRELDLDADVDPHQVAKEGDRIKCIVLRVNEPGKYVELSRRATLQNPWTGFIEQGILLSVIFDLFTIKGFLYEYYLVLTVLCL